MRAVTVAEAKRDLDGIIRRVMSDAEPAIMLTDTGEQVVLMPLDDYNAWAETRYLLTNPANAAHLRKSIAEDEAGRTDEREIPAV
jgi:antitoxin YefM